MMSKSKDRPILMSGPMVQAILKGEKTQTRRPVKWKPIKRLLDEQAMKRFSDPSVELGFYCTDVPASGYVLYQRRNGDGVWDQLVYPIHSPFGGVGARLWVKETYAQLHQPDETGEMEVAYRAGGDWPSDEIGPDWNNRGWRPSIFMPRWASRLTLTITNLRIERLTDITESDALAEGVVAWRESLSMRKIERDPDADGYFASPLFCYERLWDSLNGKTLYRAESRPWVWRIEFRADGLEAISVPD